jgi:hypothetical protein
VRIKISTPITAGAVDKATTQPKPCKHALVHEAVRVAQPSRRYTALRCTRCSFLQILELPVV